MVTLYGGNDGLNTVIPYQDSHYLKGRPNLGYQAQPGAPRSVDGLALHPNLKGMKALWDAKQLAVVRGVGYPNPVLSHFRGMDIWQTGFAGDAGGNRRARAAGWTPRAPTPCGPSASAAPCPAS